MKTKRKLDDLSDTPNISETSTLLEEIKNLLMEKNILLNEKIDNANQDISIELINKNNNNVIGQINGGVGEFKIIENGEEMEKNAFSISWVKVEDNYQGYNLGTFLITYCIYLVKMNFSDIEYIVLDDDSDGRDVNNNIYYKLGFIYQETKEVQSDDGTKTVVNTAPEMQLNINKFFNNNLLMKLNKMKMKIRNLVTSVVGGQSKRKTKTKTKSKTVRKGNKSKKRTVRRGKKTKKNRHK
jgi:hypothetical protein